MLKKSEEGMSADEMQARILKLEGTEHAHGTLIKSMADHLCILQETCERQRKMINALQGEGWKRGH